LSSIYSPMGKGLVRVLSLKVFDAVTDNATQGPISIDILPHFTGPLLWPWPFLFLPFIHRAAE
jgi:hypothetical protein